jgi:hypothetical protein
LIKPFLSITPVADRCSAAGSITIVALLTTQRKKPDSVLKDVDQKGRMKIIDDQLPRNSAILLCATGRSLVVNLWVFPGEEL